MDPRVEVGMIALNILEKLKKSGRLKGELKEIKAKLMQMQWIEDTNYLKDMAKELAELNYSFKYSEKDERMIDWCVNTLKNMWKKFDRSGSSILLGLDVGIGEIITVSPLTEKLRVCRISSKIGNFTVVTNLDVKKGDRLPFAVLPPKEFEGVISEAMFLWKPIKSIEEIDWKKVEGEVRAVLGEYR